ncbi:MAG: hypothetical protein EB069_11410, partial [Actinobacteria bacterium]|nr:hypothetical protein [Actinomycetota bacterium]
VTAGLQAISGNELAALTSLAQAGFQSGLSSLTSNKGGSGNVIDEYNVVSGGLPTSANPTEDQQIALAQFNQAATSLINDYVAAKGSMKPTDLAEALSNLTDPYGKPLPTSEINRLVTAAQTQLDTQTRNENLLKNINTAVSGYVTAGKNAVDQDLLDELKSFGITGSKAEGYLVVAKDAIARNNIAADILSKYENIDPEFGSPGIDRDNAFKTLVAEANIDSERANQLLNEVEAKNAIKLENRLNVAAAYQNAQKEGTEKSYEALRSAMTSAGYTDADINNQILKVRAIVEGNKLTAGETAQQRAELLRDIRAEAANKSTFGEAYALVRDKLGPGATFTWQGKEYVASSAAERPDLTAAGMAAKAMQGDP